MYSILYGAGLESRLLVILDESRNQLFLVIRVFHKAPLSPTLLRLFIEATGSTILFYAKVLRSGLTFDGVRSSTKTREFIPGDVEFWI